MNSPLSKTSSSEVLARLQQRPSTEEELEEENDKMLKRTTSYSTMEWRNAFLEKENEVRLVAQIGQNLLETNKRDEKTIKKLTRELSEKENELEMWKRQAKELKDEKLKLDRQLRNAEELNTSVMKELEEGQEQHRLKLAEHKVNTFLMEQNRELQDDVEALKVEVHKKTQNEEALKRRITKLEKQLQSLEENTKTLKENSNKSEETVSFTSRQRVLSMSNNLHESQKKISEMEEELHGKVRELKDVEMEKEILSKEIALLLKTNDDLLQKLNEKSNQVVELHNKLEDIQWQTTISQASEASNKGSIFSELEEQINKDKERANQKLIRAESIRAIKLSTSPQRPTSPDPKKDTQSGIYASPATEEYFYLTCSALKVNIAFKHKSENVFLVRDDELFAQASAQKIPFHEWHEWLEQQFESRTESFDKPRTLAPTQSMRKNSSLVKKK